jgi:methyl-accepting chemotaxis protein
MHSGKYGISTTLDGEQAIFFIKDISAAFDQGRRFQVSMLIGLVILLLVSSYFVFALLRRRLKPLGNAIEVLNDLSKGDLDSRVEHQRNDEIGRIGEAIDIFREKLIGFNVMNNEARRQRMKQQEEVLRQTSALG